VEWDAINTRQDASRETLEAGLIAHFRVNFREK
jgi:hypothetical protein